MKIIDIYPKDVYVSLEFPLNELKMLKKYIENSMPFYNKVIEEYPERSFLEHNFLPAVLDVIEQTDKFSKQSDKQFNKFVQNSANKHDCFLEHSK